MSPIEESNQPEQITPEPDQQSENSSHGTIEEPDHFDDLIGQAEAEEESEHIQTAMAGMLTKDQFRQSFIGMHGMAATFTGMQSLALPNTHVNQQTGEEVADVLYESILDIPMLHFILQPGNKWLGRGLVILVYVQGMRGAIGSELREKRNTQAKPKSQTQTKRQDGELSPDQVAALTGA